MRVYCLIIVLCGLQSVWSGLGIEPGPQVKATQGQVWPKPQQQKVFDTFLTVDPGNFKFKVEGEACEIIDEAVARYKGILNKMRRMLRKSSKSGSIYKYSNFAGEIPELQIRLLGFCEIIPNHDMDEHYELQVDSPDLPNQARINAMTPWGVLRGLETFTQLLYPVEGANKLLINSTTIEDYPRFPYRGLHMDTARHYMPLRVILSTLDAMAINKLNVFHWHIVDDQSFPFESTAWPELSKQGAYSPLHVYTPADVALVIETARLRGIRVIPEFDTPGHTRSWGIAYPELLTTCYNTDGKPDGTLGPMNPINNYTYNFMTNLLQELSTIFPDWFFHAGGDEVPFDCWGSNPNISQFLQENNIPPQDLEGMYITKIIEQLRQLRKTALVWQEIFENGAAIPKTTIVHIWKSWTDYKGLMANVTSAGYRAILSSCWYLDYLESGGDWEKFYSCDPTSFSGTDEQYRNVLGGEACMWAEVVDATNVQTRIWPRASAAAERLWSAATVDDLPSARKRIEEHACRMNFRGIPAAPPNGPGFCPHQLLN